ncbi:uncharacterized protein VNE69_04143 [Vairimorpha necatrix]|uniref:Uncharacterized protein n=1 Tax=Vairimorpha necatrix TaxID=6039 RepID=A0AAX4JBQ6_9MICR
MNHGQLIDKLELQYSHESWTAVKATILSCYDKLNAQASVSIDGETKEKFVKNNKQEKRETESNLESIILKEERDASFNKIIMGNFAGAPKN